MSLQIRQLSKKYKIYHDDNRTLAETLGNLRSFFKRRVYEEFWALRDIDIDINPGDQVGIIGRNGAGKSTLLKIISKITPPTAGEVKIRGRVASLLEVGTGFHLELTGRENIFLNGAILGLKRREIQQKFDEIVDFAEVAPFLDTPVKRYSSGMLARLGFAVAAHLDPDILIVDEVLAVGDKPFQEKCLKKLNEQGKNGRTVLFVSHNAGAILSLCQKGIYLEQGRLKMFGPIGECIQHYHSSYTQMGRTWSGDCGDEHIRFHRVSLSGERDFFYQKEPITVTIQLEIKKARSGLFFGLTLWNKEHQFLAGSYYDKELKKGRFTVSFVLPPALLHEGEYYLKIESGIHKVKRITTDEIALAVPVYGAFFKTQAGVFLGDQWEFHEQS